MEEHRGEVEALAAGGLGGTGTVGG
jgi:hypothetical protein